MQVVSCDYTILMNMKRFESIILIGSLFVSSAIASTHKLATYNIRFNSDADTGGKNWEHRGPICRDVVLNYDLDIIGFQEVCGTGRAYRNPATGRTQLQDITAWLEDYTLIEWDRDGNARREYMVTAFKTSRYTLLDQGSFFISPTPDKFAYGWDTTVENHPRVVGWLKLQDKISNETFIFATTHTNDGWSLDGPYGSQLVSNRLLEIADGLPIMVVADYNTGRTATDSQKGLKAYLASFYDAALEVDASKNYSLPVSNPNVSWTYNAYHPASDTGYKGSEIDYQFYRGMKILERHIVTEEFSYEGQAFPSSDHFPVYVVAEIQPENARQIFVDCNAPEGGDGTILSPFKTIGQAIEKSGIDDTINITAGVYNESIIPRYSVKIIGGYDPSFSHADGSTIIEGQGLQTPPVFVSAYVSLKLENLTIRNYVSPEPAKDGAILFRGCTLDMDNMIIENNSAVGYGGGLSAINPNNQKNCESNNVFLRNCTFRNNRSTDGGAVAVSVYGTFDINGCTFDSNSSTKAGGAAYLSFGNPETGKIWFTEAKTLITNTSFVNNVSKTSGTLMINDAMPNVTVTIVNSTFASNIIDAKGGLPSVVKTYGGAAIYAKLADSPSDSKLSKVKNSQLNIGHVTITGNRASCVAPANFNASALNASSGTVRILNSIIAGNATNGSAAHADITLGDPSILAAESFNVFTSPSEVNFTISDKSWKSVDRREGLKQIEDLMEGAIDNDLFIPRIMESDINSTHFIPLRSTLFGDNDLASLTIFNRNLEKSFSVDIDRNGIMSNQLQIDQLGNERKSKSMPGAIEYSEDYSLIDEIAEEGGGNNADVVMDANGFVYINSRIPLGCVTLYDLDGRSLMSVNCHDTSFAFDLSTFIHGFYILKYNDNIVKILK